MEIRLHTKEQGYLGEKEQGNKKDSKGVGKGEKDFIKREKKGR